MRVIVICAHVVCIFFVYELKVTKKIISKIHARSNFGEGGIVT